MYFLHCLQIYHGFSEQLQVSLVAQLVDYCIHIAEILLSSEFWSFYSVATQELKKKDL